MGIPGAFLLAMRTPTVGACFPSVPLTGTGDLCSQLLRDENDCTSLVQPTRAPEYSFRKVDLHLLWVRFARWSYKPWVLRESNNMLRRKHSGPHARCLSLPMTALP